uniref:Uncharacterized protein n=1 Tax=Arundo donax TaxID=35708 RepID=A0A0A8Y0N3_ARUDO
MCSSERSVSLLFFWICFICEVRK